MAYEAVRVGCETCRVGERSFWGNYRDLLLSRDTLLAVANGLLLLIGVLVELSGAGSVSRWLYLGSALIGGIPLFVFSARGLLIDHDITAGVMASVAMIAAIVVGEYSAAALTVFMMTLGEWLEELTLAQADVALGDLEEMVPDAVVVLYDGRQELVPLQQISEGDVILVRMGERVGADGEIVSGQAMLNEAAITGESMPVAKKAGESVYAGSLNEQGTLQVRVDAVGDGTTLGRIAELVRDAQASQAPVERVADRYARYLVPATFVIAGVVYLLTGEIMRAVTVLVVVCPCALVLATPTAVVAAIGNAAKRGILVKSGGAMERVSRIDVLALDKTGTLTEGKPTVEHSIGLDGLDRNEVLRLAASAERYSEHALGRAIVTQAQEEGLALSLPEGFQAQKGLGVAATIDGQRIVLGNRTLFAEQGIGLSDDSIKEVEALEAQGYTCVLLGLEGRLVGVIGLGDRPRREAEMALLKARALGVVRIIMITGDSERVAQQVAGELAIDQVRAEVLPGDKLNVVRELQRGGNRVAFVGDGVNDAPALAAADIGIAMGVAGTDLALESADVGLMQDDIARVPGLIALSRRTLRIIRQNVAFSMSMNVLSIVLGGLGIIGPVAGALMHELSALPVLINAARLIRADEL